MYWYFCECIHDSGWGGTRAPETISTTPGIWEIVLQLFRVVGCGVVCFLPAFVYLIYFRQPGLIFVCLIALGFFLYPMGLLSVVMHDSFEGLKPGIIMQSIYKTFFGYCGLLVLLFGMFVLGFAASFGLTALLLPSLAAFLILQLVFQVAGLYQFWISGHLLGRFYWKYRNILQWGV